MTPRKSRKSEPGQQPTKATPSRLRLREIHGHITATPETLTAWFVLAPQRWSFTTDNQREQLITAFGRRIAALAGHRVHLRVTTRPYPAGQWAENLHRNTPNPLPGWADHLVTTQRALHRSTLSDKEVFLGVDLRTRGRMDRGRSRFAKTGARAEIERQAVKLRRIADIVSGPGMEGRPAHTTEIEWLIHRSIRLGLPAATALSPTPGEDWDTDDVHAFTDGVRYSYKPFAPTVEVTASYEEGREVTRHVAVMAVGRMPALTIPQTTRDPWMQHTDRLPFAVEWASTFDVLAGPEAGKATERKRLIIRDMQKSYREHDIEEPLSLQEKAEHARQIEHETTEGDPVVAARCYGWHRLAVSADTEEECMKRVQEVKDTYQGQQITIQHPRSIVDGAAQLPLLGEFIPGEKVSSDAYQRRLPALLLAAGLPHVTATVGDRRGPYIGFTAGTSRHAVMFDPHYAMEVQETSGLIPIVGGLGSGKSGVTAKLAYESVKRGITTTVLDPAGPLANLASMPELAGHARHIDLVSGQDGVLNPYAVIGDPVRDHYETDDEWSEAVKIARMNRKMLALDVTRMLLPSQVDAMPRTPLVLNDAIRVVDPERTASLWQVVEALDHAHRGGSVDHAHDIANYLRDMAEMPQARLFFPNHVHDETEHTDTLLVLTMHGLQLPDAHQPRETWSTSEQLSVPLLHLASHYATRRVYDLDRNERKMVALDEAGMVGQWGSGRALFTQLGRNTRKWNIAAPMASQNPGDVLGMNIANWISTSFVGRIEDDDVAAEALQLLRIKTGVGYEAVLAGLSPQVALSDGHRKRGARQFIVKDVLGNVEKVTIDMSHQPDLLAAINTTATGGVERPELGEMSGAVA